MVSNPSNRIKTEAINGVILRLLGLKPGVELDYQTYHDILKKKLAIARLAGKQLPEDEDILLRQELKRVRKEKDKGIRFKIKELKSKSASSSNINIGGRPSSSGFGGNYTKSGAIVKAQSAKIIPKGSILVNVNDLSEKKEGFSSIKKTLESILKTLSSKFKFDQKQSDQERKDKESEKRTKRESGLEGFKKGISGVVSLTKKMLSPFQSIIDKIWRFIFFTLLGRAFTKFMDWMGNKENKKKFDAFVEFLSDHWPALAGIYILFGTSFRKLIRGLLKGATKMIVALAVNIPRIKKFITKNKKLVGLGLGFAALGSGYVSREVANIFGDKESPEDGLIPTKNPELDDAKKSVDQIKTSQVPTLNQGGLIPGFNFGGLIPTFGMGGFNPFGGMDFQSGVPISGAGQDNTLIAAKTGEAILTERDQQDLSQRYVERTTGEPLNIPQYLSGRKPGSVSLGNLRFPGFGGGFFKGGVVPKFNLGGIVGGGGRGLGPGYSEPSPKVNFGYFKNKVGNSLNNIFSRKYSPSSSINQSKRYNNRSNYYLKNLKSMYGNTSKYRNSTNRGLLSKLMFPKNIGRVEENEGVNIPGATADRQMFSILGGGRAALQPGETVITKLASERYGYRNLAAINSLDPNSEARKQGVRPIKISNNVNLSIPQPYKTGMGGMMTLPPIDLGASGGSRPRASGYAGGSSIPVFSAVSPVSDRDKNAKMYYGLG